MNNQNKYREDWSKGLKSVSKQSRNAPKSSVALMKKAKELANKYYGTTDLKALAPYQLDKVITWATNHSPNKGKSQSRKAEMALRQNKKYTKSAHKIKDKNIGK